MIKSISMQNGQTLGPIHAPRKTNLQAAYELLILITWKHRASLNSQMMRLVSQSMSPKDLWDKLISKVWNKVNHIFFVVLVCRQNYLQDLVRLDLSKPTSL